MGIQINGQTDTISAADGGLTIQGASGNVTGNINSTGISTFSGGIVISAGSTSAPSLAPSGDSNTGVFFPAADTIAFAEGGTEVARFDSNGRLGLGIASPTETLHISGDVRLGTGIGIGQTIYFSRSGQTDAARIACDSSSNLQLWTSTSERARIDSSGRLLLGTTSARDLGQAGVHQLQVEGLNENLSSAALIANVNTTEGPYLTLAKSRGTSDGSSTVVSSGDKLGSIQFNGADGTDIQTTGARISAEVDETPGANDMPGRLVFSTTADGASSPTERMRIDNKGFLKATTDGSYTDIDPLTHGFRNTYSGQYAISGLQSSTNPNGLRIYYSTVLNGNFNDFFYFHDSSALRARMKSNGGLVNYQANDVNLSDRNAKKDISPAAGTWDCIKEWEIVNYRYKDQPDDADLNLGVIAQQVAESCPEVITVFSEAKEAKPAVLDDDGNEIEAAQEAQPEKLGIKEQQMYWMAIKALQEAQERIETLEAQNTTLQQQNAAILARLDAAGI